MLLLATGALCAGATPASAIVVRLPDGSSLSYQPLRGASGLARSAPVLQQVEYGPWEFSFAPYSLHREVSQETTVRTTSPTVSYTFKKAGRFPVALTVFSPNGASLGTAQPVAVH
jgi:hypothetical protein